MKRKFGHTHSVCKEKTQHEDTESRQSSASQGERLQEKPTPWQLALTHQACRIVGKSILLFKPPHFVMAGGAVTHLSEKGQGKLLYVFFSRSPGSCSNEYTILIWGQHFKNIVWNRITYPKHTSHFVITVLTTIEPINLPIFKIRF